MIGQSLKTSFTNLSRRVKPSDLAELVGFSCIVAALWIGFGLVVGLGAAGVSLILIGNYGVQR